MSTRCNDFTMMIQSKPVEVEHIRLANGRIAADNSLRSPPLPSLAVDNQAFVMESTRCQAINAVRYNTLRC